MRRLVPWAIVVVVGLAYPLAFLGGDDPLFRSRQECARPATHDGNIEAVFGYFESELEARAMRDRALGAGFQGLEVAYDPCGRARVFLDGITALEVGHELVEEARTVDLDVTLEQEP